LVQGTVRSVSSATLFFRREHPSGDLEFVPLATYPHDQRVWISSGASSTTFSPQGSRVLPGGFPAHFILPDYPFMDSEAQRGSVADDGSMCVPIMFSNVVAGSLVLRRPLSVPVGRAWAEEDVIRVRMVARTIALAARLEGRWAAAVHQTAQDAELLRSVGELVRSTLHQVRSPVTALITFGRMLMQKLPLGDNVRTLAKSIVVEGFRLDELLSPLDAAGERLSLPPGAHLRRTSSAIEGNDNGNDQKPWDDMEQSEPLPRELFWVSDVLPDVADSARLLAESKELRFYSSIDDDAPPVLGHEHSMREIVHNCLDNAMKYTPKGGAVGIYAGVSENDSNEVEVIVWDTGPGVSADEMSIIWKNGFRGAAGLGSGVQSGSGLGLAIAESLASRQGGRLSLESPLPAARLSRFADRPDIDHFGPGTMLRLALMRPGR
jgi:signal transduction histidine kinase